MNKRIKIKQTSRSVHSVVFANPNDTPYKRVADVLMNRINNDMVHPNINDINMKRAYHTECMKLAHDGYIRHKQKHHNKCVKRITKQIKRIAPTLTYEYNEFANELRQRMISALQVVPIDSIFGPTINQEELQILKEFAGHLKNLGKKDEDSVKEV